MSVPGMCFLLDIVTVATTVDEWVFGLQVSLLTIEEGIFEVPQC